MPYNIQYWQRQYRVKTNTNASAHFLAQHRVVAPPSGERIGLPFLFRGRSDAVLNTKPAIEAVRAAGRTAHLAEMETVTIKELPGFDSAKSILKNWFRATHEGKTAA